MPIEGALRELAMPDVFQLLHLSRKTGELFVAQEASGRRGTVIFDNGAVVSAEIDGPTPHLGQLLLTAGKITEADLRKAEAVREAWPGRSWGDVFTSLEVVNAQEIDKYVKFQVEEVVYDILEWRDGRFSFSERALSGSDRVTWVPTESLLMEGARRADERSALPAAIDSTGALPRLSPSAVDGGIVDLSPGEWEVLGRIDGESDVKSIAWELGRTELDVSKAVAQLVQKGLVEIAAAEAAKTKPPHELALDRAAELIERGETEAARVQIVQVLEEHGSEPRAHYLAAYLAERYGGLDEAVAAYQRTLKVDPLAGDARLRLGLAHLKRGDLQSASREWTAYLRMAPDGLDRRRVERAMSAVHELERVVEEFDGREGA